MLKKLEKIWNMLNTDIEDIFLNPNITSRDEICEMRSILDENKTRLDFEEETVSDLENKAIETIQNKMHRDFFFNKYINKYIIKHNFQCPNICVIQVPK